MAHEFALVGCGGMGRRHLRGFAELARVRPGLIELAAVVDVDRDRADFVAGEVEELLGNHPVACTGIAEAKAQRPELVAADIVTTAGMHHVAAVEALDAGLHLLVEKPLAVTMRACAQIRAAASRAGCMVSVAENYRRDPILRLARGLLDAGAIGELRSIVELRAGGSDSMLITPWRHFREDGGPLMDVGVHYADMLVYLMGPVERVAGITRLLEPVRTTGRIDEAPSGMYARFRRELPDTVQATAPDSLQAMLGFASGAAGTWGLELSAPDPGMSVSMVLGSEGRLDTFGVRSGRPLRVWRGGAGPLDDADLLALVPDFALDPLTAELFGGDRLARYDLPFTQADRKLLALELGELAEAIDSGAPVEVDIDAGEAAVALVLAVHESSEAGAMLALDDVRGGRVSAYQDVTDRKLGLID